MKPITPEEMTAFKRFCETCEAVKATDDRGLHQMANEIRKLK